MRHTMDKDRRDNVHSSSFQYAARWKMTERNVYD